MKHETDCVAFESIYSTLRETLVGVARRSTDVHSAEDAVQEAFLQVLRYKRNHTDDLTKAYLVAVVKRVLARQAQRNRSRSQREESTVKKTTTSRDVFRQTTGRRERAIQRATRDLPQPQWESLVLTVVHDLSDDNASRALHRSRSSIVGARERALRSMRRSWDSLNPETVSSPVPLLRAG